MNVQLLGVWTWSKSAANYHNWRQAVKTTVKGDNKTEQLKYITYTYSINCSRQKITQYSLALYGGTVLKLKK